MPTPIQRVGLPPDAAQAIEQAEQQLHTLQHELRLLADLAGSGPDGDGHLLSLESISVVLASYADRIAALRAVIALANAPTPPQSSSDNRGDA